MTLNSDLRRLNYIRNSIDLIERRTSDGHAAFLQDVDKQDAILWRLETLAEATGKLSEELKARDPEIRWRAIYGFRNIAAHGYRELQLDRVWEIVDQHLAEPGSVVDFELDLPSK